jgi:hypothetical protein
LGGALEPSRILLLSEASVKQLLLVIFSTAVFHQLRVVRDFQSALFAHWPTWWFQESHSQRARVASDSSLEDAQALFLRIFRQFGCQDPCYRYEPTAIGDLSAITKCSGRFVVRIRRATSFVIAGPAAVMN